MYDLKLRVLEEVTGADHLRRLVGITLFLSRSKNLELLFPIFVLLELALGIEGEAGGKTESIALWAGDPVLHDEQVVILLDLLGRQRRRTLVSNNPRFDYSGGVKVGLLQLVNACKGHYKRTSMLKFKKFTTQVNLLRIKNQNNPYELFPAHTTA
jgi:hypothetical protein